MDTQRLARLMRLSQKTGTPLIVAGEEGDFVLMDLEKYEKCVCANSLPEKDEKNDQTDSFVDDGNIELPEEFFMPESTDDDTDGEKSEEMVDLDNELKELKDIVEEERFYLEPIE